MTELKTLKDIEIRELLDSEAFKIISSVSKAVIIKGEIRALAIKWVKEERVIKANKKEGLYDCFTQEERWMRRLNISEDDLK